MFDRFLVEPTELIECGGYVLVVNRTRLWGRDGIEVEAHSVEVVSFSDGHIVRWRLYRDRDDALKAVGLAD